VQDVRPIVFNCAGQSLVGVLHVPGRRGGRIAVLVVVGGPQYRIGSHRQFVLLARALADSGFPCLRFDYRGMGDSDGEARAFDAVDDDIRAAVDALMDACPDVSTVVLWGLCDAASACMMYAPNDSRIGGLIIANPWVRTDSGIARSYLHNYYGQRLLQRSFWKKVFCGEFKLGKSIAEFAGTVRSANQGRAAGERRSSFIGRMLEGWRRFEGRTLVLISERDLTAGEFTALVSSDSDWWTAATRPRVRRLDLQSADHTFSGRTSLDRASAECIDWLNSMVAT
jgi:uncharacterized protein